MTKEPKIPEYVHKEVLLKSKSRNRIIKGHKIISLKNLLDQLR